MVRPVCASPRIASFSHPDRHSHSSEQSESDPTSRLPGAGKSQLEDDHTYPYDH